MIVVVIINTVVFGINVDKFVS